MRAGGGTTLTPPPSRPYDYKVIATDITDPEGLIIMASTRIVTADGTIYLAQSAARLRMRWALWIIAGMIILPFLVAAFTGIGAGVASMISGNDDRPSDSSLFDLENAKHQNPSKECYLEWNEVQESHEVICR